ncbi:hypothetical protein ANO11243_004800 [Dothideomycetidae sp. 11243]|nr:hypothetical protein ANO11243_004800 [fungal sp. No.11243]
MKVAASVVTALGLTSSAAAAARKYYPDLITAVAPKNGNINELAINAIDGYFSIGYSASRKEGGSPSTSCPSNVSPCPPGNVTAIISSRDQAALDTEVPGGQYIFVDKDGFLAYTSPHAGVIPKNATASGFQVTGPTAAGDGRGRFMFKGKTAKGPAEGFVACPSADLGPPYTIMVKYKGFFKKYDPHHECTEIEISLSRYKSKMPAAWQYDV